MMLDDILAAYDWFDHPDGPKYVETHDDAHRNSGHWLFLPGVFSSFHKVRNNEEFWPVCVFPTSDDPYTAAAVFEFMVANLKSGRRVLLLKDDEGEAMKAAVSGDGAVEG